MMSLVSCGFIALASPGCEDATDLDGGFAAVKFNFSWVYHRNGAELSICWSVGVFALVGVAVVELQQEAGLIDEN